MAFESADLADFFSEFGKDARYNGRACRVILESFEPDEEATVSTLVGVWEVRASELAADPKPGDKLEVGGKTRAVKGIVSGDELTWRVRA